MPRSSRNSKRRRRSKAEQEWALKAVFNAMYAVGVTATNVQEAEQAIDLAAKLMSYVLDDKVTVAEIKARMLLLMEEDAGMNGLDAKGRMH